MDIIKIHPTDNVAVALKNIKSGDTFELNGDSFVAEEDIAKGHKISLCRNCLPHQRCRFLPKSSAIFVRLV